MRKLDAEPRLNGVTSTVMEWARAVAQIVNALVDSVASLTTALGLKAPIDSPAFTGTPTAPTPSSSDDSTRIATTAWAKLGFAVLFNSTGYIKFPTWLGGWLVQWGLVSISCTTANAPSGFYGATTATYPLTFPTGYLQVFTSCQDGSGIPSSAWQSPGNSNVQVLAKNPTSGNLNVAWLVVGR